MDGHDFNDALKKVKIPLLILDQKWHRLFALGGKPEEVIKLEETETALLKRQAEIKQELKDLKRVKDSLCNSVMTNMEGTSDLVSKKLDDDKRLLEECKERIKAREDELLDIPAQIDETNYELMLDTMNFCYEKLRINTQEAEDISSWIDDIRIQLKKNVIRKHNREINNKEIYSYMHDVFGLEILNLFDIENNDFLLNLNNIASQENQTTSTKEQADEKLKDVNLEEVDLKSIENETLEQSEEKSTNS